MEYRQRSLDLFSRCRRGENRSMTSNIELYCPLAKRQTRNVERLIAIHQNLSTKNHLLSRWRPELLNIYYCVNFYV